VGSVIQGSTETTFYVLTLYFGSVGIKKIRHALWVGLLVDLIGILVSIIIVGLFFQ
jgi:spore maturation protein SpmB